MGNIEIRQQSQNKKRPQIFTQRISKTPTKSFVKKSLTPINQNYKQYSPIKYFKKSMLSSDVGNLTQRKNNNEIEDFSRLTYHKTQRKSNKEQFFNPDFNQTKRAINYHNKFSQSYHLDKVFSKKDDIKKEGTIVPNKQIWSSQLDKNLKQNKQQKCVQIIKKVRNFNDFLNQIKKKLKQQSHLIKQHQTNSLIRKQVKNKSNNLNSQEQNQQESSKKQKKIQISLKLQNQRLQLQKYRNLVERQLSKNHSIENITLSTKKSGEKILTIQYEDLNFSKNNQPKVLNNKQIQQIKKVSSDEIQKKRKSDEQYIQRSQKEQISLDKKFNQKENQQPLYNNAQRVSLKLLRQRYDATLKIMNQLGKTIEKLQKEEALLINSKNRQDNCKGQKIQTISMLLNKIDKLQEQCTSTDSWIKQYINQKDKEKTNTKEDYFNKIDKKFNQSSVKYQLSSQEEDDDSQQFRR